MCSPCARASRNVACSILTGKDALCTWAFSYALECRHVRSIWKLLPSQQYVEKLIANCIRVQSTSPTLSYDIHITTIIMSFFVKSIRVFELP